MIVLLVSVMALLVASGGLAYHIWREQRAKGSAPAKRDEAQVETEDAP